MPDESARAAGERVYKSLWCWLPSEGPGFLKWGLGAEWVYRGSGPETLMIHESPLLRSADSRVCAAALFILTWKKKSDGYCECVWVVCFTPYTAALCKEDKNDIVTHDRQPLSCPSRSMHTFISKGCTFESCWGQQQKKVALTLISTKTIKTVYSIASALGAEDPKVCGTAARLSSTITIKGCLKPPSASSVCPLQNFNYVKGLGLIFFLLKMYYDAKFCTFFIFAEHSH